MKSKRPFQPIAHQWKPTLGEFTVLLKSVYWPRYTVAFVLQKLKQNTSGIEVLTQKIGKERGKTVCSHTFTLFWSRKTSVIIKIFWLSFHVFACAFPMVISSIFGKSFPFPFPYFVLDKEQCHFLPQKLLDNEYDLWSCIVTIEKPLPKL